MFSPVLESVAIVFTNPHLVGLELFLKDELDFLPDVDVLPNKVS